MKVHIYKRFGKFICDITLPDNADLSDLKDEFCAKYHFYPERQRFYVGNSKGNSVKDGLLSESEVIDDTNLYFKDLGVQISWRLVFVLEYLGPILIYPLFYFAPQLFYEEEPTAKSHLQKLMLFLLVAHFIKREFETLFIHRFSNGTMPLQRLPINCAHYWLGSGVAIAYYIFHPLYSSHIQSFLVQGLLALAMIGFEYMNLRTHIILRNLRPRGSKTRGIPQGSGFQWVSCANYFWETLAWVSFSLLAGCLTSWIFTCIAFAQMAQWSFGKHRKYKKEFGSSYPKNRTAIIPKIL